MQLEQKDLIYSISIADFFLFLLRLKYNWNFFTEYVTRIKNNLKRLWNAVWIYHMLHGWKTSSALNLARAFSSS